MYEYSHMFQGKMTAKNKKKIVERTYEYSYVRSVYLQQKEKGRSTYDDRTCFEKENKKPAAAALELLLPPSPFPLLLVMSPLVWVLAVLVVVCRLLGAVCLNGW
jgi:hypothetical protein